MPSGFLTPMGNKLVSWSMCPLENVHHRLVAILSLVAFFSLLIFMSAKRFEGVCLASQSVEAVSFQYQSTAKWIESCSSKKEKVRLNYLQYQKFETVKKRIDELDSVVLPAFGTGTIKKIKIEFDSSSNLKIASDSIKVPDFYLERQGSHHWIQLAVTALIFKQGKLPPASSAQQWMTSELLALLVLESVGASPQLVSEGEVHSLPLLVKPSLRSKTCYQSYYSVIIPILCSQVVTSNFEVSKMAVQDFIMSLIHQKVSQLTPLKKLQILEGFKGDWAKYEPISKVADDSIIKNFLDSDQETWLNVNIKIISSMIGTFWDVSISRNFLQDYTLIQAPISIEEHLSIDIPGNFVLTSLLNEPDFGVSKFGFVKLGPSSLNHDIIQLQCYPPIVKDILKLPETISRVTLIQKCQGDFQKQIQSIVNLGISEYLKTHTDIAFFQIHLPSLRWLYKKSAINPFILVEAGNFNHPIFSSMGWKEAIYKKESNSFLVSSAVEVIQQYRLSSPK